MSYTVMTLFLLSDAWHVLSVFYGLRVLILTSITSRSPLVGFICSSWYLLDKLLVSPLVVSQCRVIGYPGCLLHWLLLVTLPLDGQSVSVINGVSSDVQLELGVIGDSSTASSESVIADSLSLSRGRWIKTLLRVWICGLLWSFIKAASL